MVTARLLVLIIATLLATGCAAGTKVRDFGTFDPKQQRDALYIIPFNTTLVPPDVGEPVFNEFVDQLNKQGKKTNIANFVILKEELKEVEPAWLVKQSYISGDIWGFVESSGCCSTGMTVKSRIYLYEPAKTEPSLEIFVPVEEFFEHDRVAPQTARARLGKKLATELVNAIMQRLKP
jgi:hypothetical protein